MKTKITTIMLIIRRWLILYKSRSIRQGRINAGCPTNGLRLLARMIACHLIAGELRYEKNKKSSQASGQEGLSDRLRSDPDTEVKKGRQHV